MSSATRTVLGKIALEEAYEVAGNDSKSMREAKLYIHPNDRDRYIRQISDINDERVRLADELRRCVKDLGFHGALVSNFQHAGPNGENYLFYDAPEYDVFWKTCQELDVPLYIHPSASKDVIYEKLYADRKFLVGPPLSFANDVSLHLLGLITNGVFDRNPNLKIIVGHLGEHIPFDFWCINHWLEDVERPIALEQGYENFVKLSIYDYFKKNIWVTTSGHFSNHSLEYVVRELSPERVLFSVDYPYETIENCCAWWDGKAEEIIEAVGGLENYVKIERENAKGLLLLRDYQDEDVDAPLG